MSIGNRVKMVNHCYSRDDFCLQNYLFCKKVAGNNTSVAWAMAQSTYIPYNFKTSNCCVTYLCPNVNLIFIFIDRHDTQRYIVRNLDVLVSFFCISIGVQTYYGKEHLRLDALPDTTYTTVTSFDRKINNRKASMKEWKLEVSKSLADIIKKQLSFIQRYNIASCRLWQRTSLDLTSKTFLNNPDYLSPLFPQLCKARK